MLFKTINFDHIYNFDHLKLNSTFFLAAAMTAGEVRIVHNVSLTEGAKMAIASSRTHAFAMKIGAESYATKCWTDVWRNLVKMALRVPQMANTTTTSVNVQRASPVKIVPYR